MFLELSAVFASGGGLGRIAGRADPRLIFLTALGERLHLLRWRPDSTKYICGCLCGHFEIWKALC